MIFMPSSCGLGHFHATYPSLPKCGTCRWHTLQIKLKSIARNVSRLIRLDLWMSFGPLEVHLLMACGVYHGRHRSKHRTQPVRVVPKGIDTETGEGPTPTPQQMQNVDTTNRWQSLTTHWVIGSR